MQQLLSNSLWASFAALCLHTRSEPRATFAHYLHSPGCCFLKLVFFPRQPSCIISPLPSSLLPPPPTLLLLLFLTLSPLSALLRLFHLIPRRPIPTLSHRPTPCCRCQFQDRLYIRNFNSILRAAVRMYEHLLAGFIICMTTVTDEQQACVTC